MQIKIARFSLYVLSVFALAWALPTGYNFIFDKEVAKTAMFYSPTDKLMVYTEQLRIDDENARAKSENHHADVAYKNAKGDYFTREEFEAKIPFIYFRNMEMRGLLPLNIEGQEYDRAIIEKHRRVFEITGAQMSDTYDEYKIYPLLESNPNQVALVLPTDRFRMSKNSMDFINSDINSIDKDLTKLFTDALMENEFTFPAKNVWGNFTIFKPYDAGIFALDSAGKTFHIARKNGLPVVVKLPFAKDIIPQKILVTEAQDRKFYGLLVDNVDNVYLLHVEDYALTHIPSPKYNPKKMDFKVLLDPIYLTAIYSDSSHIYANAYYYNSQNAPNTLTIEDSYDMPMARAQRPLYTKIADILFPFSIELSDENSLKGSLSIQFSMYLLNFGLLMSFLLALIYTMYYKRNGYSISSIQSLSIVLLGLYILIPYLLMEEYRKK